MVQFILSVLAPAVLAAAPPTEPARSRAFAIAAANLRANVEKVDGKQYLLAGANQFRTLWARDLSMSVQGALAAGMNGAVRDSLAELFKWQRADGLLPRVVDNRSIESRVLLGMIGLAPEFKAPLKPGFETEYKVISLDSNVVVVWAAGQYLRKTHDRAFARLWYPAAVKAVEFLEKEYGDEDGILAHQPPFSDWQDSIRREGRVALTNLYYALALRALAEWSLLADQPLAAALYALKSHTANAVFVDHFWDEKLGALRNFDGDEGRLSADVNLMAVAYGLVDGERAEQTLATLKASPLWQPMPGRATWPDYPSSMKGRNAKLAGLKGYHDQYWWYWLTALAARAEGAVGDCAERGRILDELARRIADDGKIHEIYRLRKNGELKPVRTWIYRAEEPFTWNSAMVLEALAEGC